jgi:F-type H+-transporting ATPase subunit c
MMLFIVSIVVAGFAMAIGSLLTANAQGNALGKAMEGISRQPEASGAINGTLIIGLAFIESIAIYVLIVSMIIIFLKPFSAPYLEAETAKQEVEKLNAEIAKARLFNLDAKKLDEVKKELALEMARKDVELDNSVAKLTPKQKEVFEALYGKTAGTAAPAPEKGKK